MTGPMKGELWNADLGEMTEEQVKELFAHGERKQKNAERIVIQYLREGLHYGYASEDGGESSILPERPMLYQAGAELLRERFRYHIQHQRNPLIHQSKHLVSVTVEVGIYTQGNRLLAVSAGHCNSKDDFWRRGKRAWKYTDPRDVTPGILTLAQQRAGKLATREALGLTAFFCDPEEHQRVFAEAPVPKGLMQWNDVERATAKALVKSLGMKQEEFVRMVCRLVGHPMVATGDEAEIVIGELQRRVERRDRGNLLALSKEIAS